MVHPQLALTLESTTGASPSFVNLKVNLACVPSAISPKLWEVVANTTFPFGASTLASTGVALSVAVLFG